MKKAFTLIELLVVIGILTILFAMGMNFGNARITQLKAQTLKERFVDSYVSLLDQRLISSYQGVTRYRELSLYFGSGLLYAFDSGVFSPLSSFGSTMQLTGIALDGKDLNSFVIKAFPYRLSCVPSLSGKLLTFDVLTLGSRYCFSLDIVTCRLRELMCTM